MIIIIVLVPLLFTAYCDTYRDDDDEEEVKICRYATFA